MSNTALNSDRPTTLEKIFFNKIMEDSREIERKIEEENQKILNATPSYVPYYFTIDRRTFGGKIAYFVYKHLTPYFERNG